MELKLYKLPLFLSLNQIGPLYHCQFGGIHLFSLNVFLMQLNSSIDLSLDLLCPQVVSDAAGQGVTITGSKTFNNWNWPNAVIFAATVITTIGKYIFWGAHQ